MFQDVTHKNTGKSNLLKNPINQFPVNVRIYHIAFHRSSRPEAVLRKCVLIICSKFTGEHSCRIVILTKLLCNFIEITLRMGVLL